MSASSEWMPKGVLDDWKADTKRFDGPVNILQVLDKWLPLIDRRGDKCLAMNVALGLWPELKARPESAPVLLAAILLETFEAGQQSGVNKEPSVEVVEKGPQEQTDKPKHCVHCNRALDRNEFRHGDGVCLSCFWKRREKEPQEVQQ